MQDIISQISTSGASFTSQYGNQQTTMSQADKTSQKIIGEVTGKSMAGIQPTPNFWTATAKEALAVVDVLNQDGKSVLTSFESLKDLTKGDLVKDFMKGSFVDKIGLFKKTLSIGNSVFDKKAIFDKVTAAIPNLRSSIASIGFDSKMFTDVFKGVDLNAITSAFKDNIPLNIGNMDIKELNGLKDLLKTYTGDLSSTTFGNLNIDKTMITNLVNVCAKTNMKDSIGPLLNLAKDKGVLIDVARSCLGGMGKNPDANILESVAKAISGKAVTALNPDIIKIFTSAVKIDTPVPTPTTSKMVLDPDYKKFLEVHGEYGASDGKLGKEAYKDSIQAFDVVNPNWRLTPTPICNQTSVYDMTTVMGSSNGFKDIYVSNSRVTGTEADKVLAMGVHFENTTVEEILNRDFPLTVISTPLLKVSDSFISTSAKFVPA